MENDAYHVTDEAAGHALAAQLQVDIEHHGLATVLAADYIPEQRALRVAWPKSAVVLDFPASPEWVESIRMMLPTYARSRLPAIRE